MVSSYVLVEGMRPGTALEGIPLTLMKIERFTVENPEPKQPPVWTTVEFTFAEEDADRVAQASEPVAEALRGSFDLEPRGPVDLKGKGDTESYLLRTAR